jgi:hypothetical protein
MSATSETHLRRECPVRTVHQFWHCEIGKGGRGGKDDCAQNFAAVEAPLGGEGRL